MEFDSTIGTSLFNGNIVELVTSFTIKRYFENIIETKLEDLNPLHDLECEALKSNLYKIMQRSSFLSLYRDVVSEVEALIPYRVLCQKNPTVRVQRPGENSIIFHIDEWAGHDKRSLNVWFPLVDVSSSSSLGIVDSFRTSVLLDAFYKGKLSADELELESRNSAIFSAMSVGEALLFGNHTLHGTRINNTDKTRISLDFRVTPVEGSVNLHQRYINPTMLQEKSNITPRHRRAFCCIRSENKLKDLSFPEQRLLINSYCNRHEIDLIGETHEIHGRSSPDLPFLSRAIRKYPSADLIIISKDCFYTEELPKLERISSDLARQGNNITFIIN